MDHHSNDSERRAPCGFAVALVLLVLVDGVWRDSGVRPMTASKDSPRPARSGECARVRFSTSAHRLALWAGLVRARLKAAALRTQHDRKLRSEQAAREGMAHSAGEVRHCRRADPPAPGLPAWPASPTLGRKRRLAAPVTMLDGVRGESKSKYYARHTETRQTPKRVEDAAEGE